MHIAKIAQGLTQVEAELNTKSGDSVDDENTNGIKAGLSDESLGLALKLLSMLL